MEATSLNILRVHVIYNKSCIRTYTSLIDLTLSSSDESSEGNEWDVLPNVSISLGSTSGNSSTKYGKLIIIQCNLDYLDLNH